MKHLSLQGFFRGFALGGLAACCSLMDGLLTVARGQGLPLANPLQTGVALTERPPVIVLPWQNIAVVAEDWRRALTELSSARQSWLQAGNAAGEIGQQQSLAAYLTSKNTQPPINLKPLVGAAVTAVWPGSPLSERPLVITPAVCALADAYLIMIAVYHRDERYLFAAGHHLISKADWQQALQAKQLTTTLNAALSKTWRRTINTLRNQAQRPPAALQLGLSLQQASSRPDHGSNLCLQQLVAEQLTVRGFKLTPIIGSEDLASLDHLWPNPAKRTRPTRQLLMLWQYPPEGHPSARRKFPLELSLRTSHAEAVFAGHIEPGSQSTWRFAAAADGTLAYELAPELLAFIEQEEKTLALDTLPRIAAINRAWVYLDKGRAYGLKINDRLVVNGAAEPIEGHVVGYFGPELKLVTPQGQAVHEGAIVYIRRGQRLTKLGQQLGFDPEVFPSPWPPRQNPTP